VLPQTMLEDSATGHRIPANSVPGIQLVAQQPSGQYAPPGQAQSQPYAGYYRGQVIDTGHNDLTLAYVFAALGLVMCVAGGLCGPCSLVGLVFPILGVVFANKATQKGNPGANGARIMGWVGIALQILAIVLYVALVTMGGIFS
jgi:hypothetical protein